MYIYIYVSDFGKVIIDVKEVGDPIPAEFLTERCVALEKSSRGANVFIGQ